MVVDGARNTAALVAAARRGDEGAFAVLVARDERQVAAVTYRILGDCHAVQDAAQETVAEAYRGLPRLRDPARSRTDCAPS